MGAWCVRHRSDRSEVRPDRDPRETRQNGTVRNELQAKSKGEYPLQQNNMRPTPSEVLAIIANCSRGPIVSLSYRFASAASALTASPVRLQSIRVDLL
jgi:hypothetical protein